MIFAHFWIWRTLGIGFEKTFIRYYIFLTMLFVMVITTLYIMKKIYPDYVGFAFLGLVMLKLAVMIIVINKLGLSKIPDFKIHFIPPYLISIVLEALYAVRLIHKYDNIKY
jgi:hypothetical protein